ncbi:MAG: M48 family metallopeptidase [Patescibacteria group bacterium]
MTSLYTHQDSNIRKTWALFTTFFIVVIGIGWVFSYTLDTPALLPIAVVVSILMGITSYWYSDKIVIASTHAVPADGTEFLELNRIVDNLAITAGLPKPRVYVVRDPAPNAFATGRDPEHAAIAVTTGLLQILDKAELEGVIAHELSHVGNRDILVSTVAVVLVGFIALISDWFLRSLWYRRGGGDRKNGGAGILLLVGIVLALLSPIIAQLMQLAISRKREFLADASGALLTRYPDGLASALAKIAAHDRPLIHTNNAVNHVWLDDPDHVETSGRRHWFANLFATHPPIADRIAALRSTEK